MEDNFIISWMLSFIPTNIEGKYLLPKLKEKFGDRKLIHYGLIILLWIINSVILILLMDWIFDGDYEL